MDILKEWVKKIFIVIIMLSFIEILLPDRSIQKFVKYIFSLIIMITILGLYY